MEKMKRIVVLGAAESGVGAAALAKVKGFDVFVSDMGTIKDSQFSRLSARANTEYNLFDGKLTIGENFTLNRTKGTDAPDKFLRSALQFNPNFPIYAENGEYLPEYPTPSSPIVKIDREAKTAQDGLMENYPVKFKNEV